MKKKASLCSSPTATSHVIERLPHRLDAVSDSAKAGTWQAYLEKVYGARSAGDAAPTDLRSFTWFYSRITASPR